MTTIGRRSPNKVRKKILDGDWTISDDFINGNGMALIRPTSIASSGKSSSSARIVGGGSVEFSLCDYVALNGVFTANYDNYMIVVRSIEASNAQAQWSLRLRVAGVDNATASSYVSQLLTIDSTFETGSRSSADYGWFVPSSSTIENGGVCYIYGPYLAQPTAYRVVSMQGTSNSYINDYAVTHNQSTSYDGFTMQRSTFSYTGLVSVYGLEN